MNTIPEPTIQVEPLEPLVTIETTLGTIRLL